MDAIACLVKDIPPHGPLFEGAMAVYGEAFAQPPYSDGDRGREIRQRMKDTHARRPGFRMLVALASPERVVGMAYGYHGSRGQWWHDAVTKQVTREQSAEWLSDAYELVELAVHPEYQGRGIGSSLIYELLDGCQERTCVLSTRADSEAHRLYDRLGFEHIVEMMFTAGGWPFYVMGKKLH
jgi:ribosomal protein S18 acetylase RimI-like enzyme